MFWLLTFENLFKIKIQNYSNDVNSLSQIISICLCHCGTKAIMAKHKANEI